MNVSARSWVLRETFIIAGLFSAIYYISSRLDVFESIAEWVEKLEPWEIDDFLVAVFFVTSVLGLLSFRRGKKIGAELERSKVSQIIERKQAQDALRESERRYRELSDLLPQTIYEYDVNGRLTFVNRAFYRTFGYEEADFHNALAALDLIAPEDRLKAMHNMKRRIAGEHIGSAEYLAIRKDGTIFPLTVYSNSVMHEGKVVGTRGIAVDATEQKSIENALREAGERFRAIFNNAFQLTAILAPDGTILEVNQTALDFSGVKPEDAVGKPMWDSPCWSFSKDVRDRLKEGIRKAANGSLVRYETENLRGAGEVALLDFSLKPVAIGSNPVALLIAEGRDITGRKLAEKALMETKEMLQALIDASPMGINLLDARGNVLLWNPAAEQISGWSDQEVLGRFYPALAEYNKTEFLEQDSQIFEGRSHRSVETRALRKDGSFIDVSLWTAPVRDASGKIFAALGIFSDISEQKKADTERKVLREHLAQAQKMEAIGTLAGGIAHDFNNILAAIFGYTELVLNNDSISGQNREHLQKVLAASFRARELVKQILLFSRKGEGQERTALDIVPVIREILTFLRYSIPRTIEIRLDLKCEAAIVQANTTSIHQILVNLCTNAAHAVEENGGNITIGLSKFHLSESEAKCHLGLRPGRYAQIEVSDTGCGMDKLTLERIFDPYFTTKGIGKGTGLGLAVVHGIVKQHKGAIEVVSQPGIGSTFQVFLPLSDSATAEALWPAGLDEPISLGKERILVVDDEDSLAKMTADMLKRLGYNTVAASDCREALEIFKSKPDQFDLVLTDFTMPGMTGEDLARAILEIRPQIPIILVTGYNQRTSEVTAREIGIREFLMKPLTMRDLGEAVRRALDSHP